jgi:protein TonB
MGAPVQLSRDNRNDRIKSAAGAIAFHALLGYAFLTGLGFDIPQQISQELKTFNVTEEAPPPPAELPPPDTEESENNQTKDPEGAASPANLKDTPSPIMVPEPKIKIPVPPPVIAAPAAGQGNAPSAGATDIPGPGTGSGGVGTGLGSGQDGYGTGGGGGGRGTPARWIRGSITDDDYPRGAVEARASGTVFLRFVVAPDGRVSNCNVTRSSGRADLDATTCRLIMRRFRYRPARDARGNPIPDVITGNHEWHIQQRPGLIVIEEPDEEVN